MRLYRYTITVDVITTQYDCDAVSDAIERASHWQRYDDAKATVDPAHRRSTPYMCIPDPPTRPEDPTPQTLATYYTAYDVWADRYLMRANWREDGRA